MVVKVLTKNSSLMVKEKNYNDVVTSNSQKKLNRQVKECLVVATDWETPGTAPEQPSVMKDTFSTSTVTSDEVEDHCDRI